VALAFELDSRDLAGPAELPSQTESTVLDRQNSNSSIGPASTSNMNATGPIQINGVSAFTSQGLPREGIWDGSANDLSFGTG